MTIQFECQHLGWRCRTWAEWDSDLDMTACVRAGEPKSTNTMFHLPQQRSRKRTGQVNVNWNGNQKPVLKIHHVEVWYVRSCKVRNDDAVQPIPKKKKRRKLTVFFLFSVEKLNAAYTLLSAFGNSRTCLNATASRFSQVFTVDFDHAGQIASASVQVKKKVAYILFL